MIAKRTMVNQPSLGALVCMVAVVLALPAAAGGRPAGAALPAPVTLTDISGVTPWMTIGAIRRHWRLRVPFYQSTSGSSLVGQAIVCGGPMRGVAFFWTDQLQYIWWTQGARTDKNVGIGSTLVQLKQAYGQDLLQGGSYNDFYIVAQSSAPPVIAIHFLLNNRGRGARVYDVVWGAYGAIKRSGAISSDAPFRVNC